MDDAPRMGKRDRIRDAHQDPQILRQGRGLDDFRPGRAAHPFHGVEQRAGIVRTEIVDRHDVRVFQITRHDGLRQELGAVVRIVLDLRFQHLERDGAIDGRLPGGVDHPHAPLADHVQQFVIRRLGDRFLSG